MTRKTMIGIPAHDGTVDVECANALFHTAKLCAAHGIDVTPVYWPGEAMIQAARNNLAKVALETNCDDLVFIDADQTWEPSNVLALLQHRADVVGAAVRKKTEDRELYNVKASNLNIPVDIRTGLWAVDAIGTGFIRLSRKALIALWDMSEPYRDDSGNQHRMMFEIGVVEGRLVGEDVAMCLKLKQAGFSILLDPSFTISHIGRHKFQGRDFAAWIKKLQGEEAARRAKATA